MPQHAWGLLNCLNTHFLCFKLIIDMAQLEWVSLNSLDICFLCLKVISNKKCAPSQQHFFVARFSGNIPKYIFKQVSHFIYALKARQGLNFMVFFNHFHNPHFHELFNVCAATKTGARKLPNVQTKREPKLTI